MGGQGTSSGAQNPPMYKAALDTRAESKTARPAPCESSRPAGTSQSRRNREALASKPAEGGVIDVDDDDLNDDEAEAKEQREVLNRVASVFPSEQAKELEENKRTRVAPPFWCSNWYRVYWYHLTGEEILIHAFRQASRGTISLRDVGSFVINKGSEGAGGEPPGGAGSGSGERAKPPPPPFPGNKGERPKPPPPDRPPDVGRPEPSAAPSEPPPRGRPTGRSEEYP